MSIRHAIWKVGSKPAPLVEASLGKGVLLEHVIVEDPTILSDRWMLIGRQLRTTYGETRGPTKFPMLYCQHLFILGRSNIYPVRYCESR